MDPSPFGKLRVGISEKTSNCTTTQQSKEEADAT
jgi:hypothetical protein